MEALDVWIARATRTTPTLFAKDYPHPVLLFKGTAGVVASQSLDLFKTQSMSDAGITTTAALADEVVAPPNTVYILSKRPDGPYPERISIGRARTNDVPINFPRISKLHALLTWSPDRHAHFITDMETTNGTAVEDMTLSPKVTVPLPDKASVAFGPYLFVFYLPQSLYVFLRSLG